jgi:hypothetical protein
LRETLETLVDQPAGEVPDGSEPLREPFRLDKDGNATTIFLEWAPSCDSDDPDYAIYMGHLGDYSSHAPWRCTTLKRTTWSWLMPPGDIYFLVVPHNGWREGSYGRDSNGQARPASSGACFAQQVGTICE